MFYIFSCCDLDVLNLKVKGLDVEMTIQFELERGSESDTPPTPNCPPENCSHQKRDGNIMLQITSTIRPVTGPYRRNVTLKRVSVVYRPVHLSLNP